MSSSKDFLPEKQGGGASASKECCIILATTALSLHPPLSLLLLSRLSAARFSSTSRDEKIPFPTSLLLHTKTTLIFSLLVSAVAVAALVEILTGKNLYYLISKRRRLSQAWAMLFLMLVCLNLGFDLPIGTDTNIRGGGDFVTARRLVFVLGLHEIMVLWRRSVVKPVVDEAVSGIFDEGFGWMEKAVMAAALGYVWSRRLRGEVEALAALPRVRTELGMHVEAADVLGWWLYYLTAAIGGVKVVKVLLWAANKFYRHICRISVLSNQSAEQLV
ncbi:hypothetical protein AAHA92_08833 [Salvia divinorum]|uniref:DUF4220 domain-containing protein n=1 Tax=Salvia divinorum TaxID=28513 RepID=A0ABD1HSY2_SALDI